MKAFAVFVLVLFAQTTLAANAKDQQFFKLAEEYNKHLPRKYGNMVVEKVRYLPHVRTLVNTHRLLDKDISEINPDMLGTYQHMSKQSFARLLCLAKPAPKSRAYLLKKENLLLKYQYVDRNNKPLFAFAVSKEDCATVTAPEHHQ